MRRNDHASPFSSSPAWPAEDRQRVVDAFRRGGRKAVHAAFPDRSFGAVHNAIRRFVDARPMGSSAAPVDVDEIRARIRQIPFEQVCHRLADLIDKPIERPT